MSNLNKPQPKTTNALPAYSNSAGTASWRLNLNRIPNRTPNRIAYLRQHFTRLTAPLVLTAATCLTATITPLFNSSEAQAQLLRSRRSLAWDQYLSGSRMLQAFEPIVDQARRSVASIRCDGRIKAFGTLIDEDGHLLTKASEVQGATRIECEWFDGSRVPAVVVATDPQTDLALLKLTGKTLLTHQTSKTNQANQANQSNQPISTASVQTSAITPISWASTEQTAYVGQWAITCSADETPLAIGIVSSPNRTIPERRLILGLRGHAMPKTSTIQGVRVTAVLPNRGAAAAGLQVDDIVTHIDNQPVTSLPALSLAINEPNHQTDFAVTILRPNQQTQTPAASSPPPSQSPTQSSSQPDAQTHYDTLTLTITVSALKEPDRRHMQGQISDRDYGFEQVIQHDTVLQPRDCGGPLLNSDGQAIGINIARAGRVASYALPVDVVQAAIRRLRQNNSIILDTTTNKPANLSDHTIVKPPKTQKVKPYLRHALTSNTKHKTRTPPSTKQLANLFNQQSKPPTKPYLIQSLKH